MMYTYNIMYTYPCPFAGRNAWKFAAPCERARNSQAHNGSLGLCDCRTGCARWKDWLLMLAVPSDHHNL